VEKDVAVLDATLWNSSHTIRYAIHENGYSFDEIHAHRVRRPLGPGIRTGRRRLVITTIGRDIAAMNLELDMRVIVVKNRAMFLRPAARPVTSSAHPTARELSDLGGDTSRSFCPGTEAVWDAGRWQRPD
jgi:hypothetical protein